MSEHTAFGAQQAYSVFEAMRPDPGLGIDRMACLTYSLDLVAVTAMLISMTGAVDDELSGGPMCLADALGSLGPRLRILYQKGRLQPARNHFGILHLFDGVLHSVRPQPGASWHPKALLTRYLGDDKSIRWRFWLGSRNLTISADREAGLLLHGMPARKGQRIPEIAQMIRALAGQLDWPEAILVELADLRWQAPAGVKFRKLHWRALGTTKPFFTPLPKSRRTLLISPFVNAGGLKALTPRPAGSTMELLTIPTTANALGEQAGMKVRVNEAPQPDQPALVATKDETSETEAPDPIRMSGLHAKLILQKSDTRNRLWIGSANITGRGLVDRNVELMAELDIDDAIAGTLEAFVEAQEFASVAPPSAETLEREAAARALDDALQAVLDLEFVLTIDADGLSLEVSDSLDAFLDDYRLEAWLFTFPDSVVEWPTNSRRIVLRPGQVPLKLQTFLVSFRAESRGDPTVKRAWTQEVQFPGLDALARDRAATAAYIGASNLATWFRARLQGITPTESTTWAGADKNGASWGVGDGPFGIGRFALEEVLAAWARNPSQFEERATAISEVLDGFRLDLSEREDEEGVEALRQLDEVESFWSSVRACLDIGAPHGA
ncbi:hypothetical protein [Mesorhizobium intechi]|uniref:hypothetical protein n=1 Tax=Mesorhizobium intechi TaxID=537601 RepID=UPI00142EDF9F|nr:hypothetical protein [Mesorhizobium intechi]